TVIVPLGGGIVGSYLGWDALKGRISDDLHKSHVEESLTKIDQNLDPIADQIKTIQRYESALSEHDQKDVVLAAVLQQYKNMHSALESFHTMQTSKKESEKGELADNIMGVIAQNLAPVKQAPQLPNQPLVIGLGMNKYKIIFAVPMSRTPDINFGQLPQGVTTEITDTSKFGFTVEFKGVTGTLDPFGFSANVEL
ncbi:hypothetical protein CGH91_23235, partial [Vibrio parahaemolyticus]